MNETNSRLSCYDNFSPLVLDMPRKNPMINHSRTCILTPSTGTCHDSIAPMSSNIILDSSNVGYYKNGIQLSETSLSRSNSAKVHKDHLQTFTNDTIPRPPALESLKYKGEVASVLPITTSFPLEFKKDFYIDNFMKKRSNSSSSTITATTTLSNQSTVADSIICATNNDTLLLKNPSGYCSKQFKFPDQIVTKKSVTEMKEIFENCFNDNDAANVHKVECILPLNNDILQQSSSSSLSMSSMDSLASSSSSSLNTSIINNYSTKLLKPLPIIQQRNGGINKKTNSYNCLSREKVGLCDSVPQKNVYSLLSNNRRRKIGLHISNEDELNSFILIGQDGKPLRTINNKELLKWPVMNQFSKKLNSKRKEDFKKIKQKSSTIRHLMFTLALLFLALFLLLVVFGLSVLLIKNKKIFDLFENYHQTFDYTVDSIHKHLGKNDIDNPAHSKTVDEIIELTKNKTHSNYLRRSPYNIPMHRDANDGKKLIELFDSERIRKNLRDIASNIHVAGTTEQLELMDRLADQYRNLNYEVESFEYDALLSYPDYDRPNTINVWNDDRNEWNLLSNGLSERLGTKKDLLKQQEDPRGLVWWNAYSRNGSATAEIVYVNYGTSEDYRALEKLNISIKNKIALMRYGSLFRGDKASLAEKNGAAGVILYSDPYDFALDLTKSNQTFPHDIWLPPSGAQRGTLLRTVGDPETPFLPSKPYMYRRLNENELRSANILPNIPITSIGYGDALKIFKYLDEIEAPWSNWLGSLNVSYSITGSTKFKLVVNAYTERRRIKNFIALMRGDEEPDKWILLGNHADAWTRGAVDPGTATATMLEMANVLGIYAAENYWRPRRTICFCQWDAEEFGSIGSTEWIEEHLRLLESRAIAYINVDNINGNNTLAVKAVPLLYRATVEAASRVKHPLLEEMNTKSNRKESFQTLLDAWKFFSPKGPLPGDRSVPAIQMPSSGSDFQRFVSFAGIPVADLRMESAPIYSYMIYHSMYEIPWTVENLIDKDFNACKAMGQMWLELGRNLANSLIIPFNVEDYGIMLNEYFTRMEAQLLHMRIDLGLGKGFFREKMGSLQNSILEFQRHAIKIQHLVQAANSGEITLSLRQVIMLNDRLQSVERAFILDRGIFRERSFFRHSVLTASENELYPGSAFALILDPAFKWWEITNKFKSEFDKKTSNGRKLKYKTKIEAEHWIKTIRTGFSNLQYTVESASTILKLDHF